MILRPPAIALAAVCALATSSAAQAGDARALGDGVVMPPAARIDSVFAEFARPGSPGCVVSVMRAGEVIFSRGYGLADVRTGEPMSTRVLLGAGSLTKQFTAFAVAMLVAEGRIQLDADVHRYLPELPRYPHRVTVRHLLHHASGVREYTELPSLAGTGESGKVLFARANGLSFAPGSQYLYSNSGFLLLGRLVQRVSGRPLGAFLTERIFTPLGMTHTIFPTDSAAAAGRTMAYLPFREAGWSPVLPPVDAHGDAGVYTTPEDLARWDRNFYDGRVGGRRVLAILHDTLRMNDGSLSTYSFGLHREPYRGLTREYHGGQEYGYRHQWWRFPDQRLSVLTMCNTRTAEPDGLTERVADLFLAPAYAAAGHPLAPEPAIDSASAASYLGFYVSKEANQYRNVAWRDGKLKMRIVVTYYDLSPLGDGRFSVRGQPITVTFHPATGGAMRLEERYAASTRPVAYERPAATTPQPPLTDYTGTYRSAELSTRWIFRAALGGRLRITMPRDSAELRRAGQDVFSDGYLLVVFNRNGEGRITGFAASAPRTLGVQFTRER